MVARDYRSHVLYSRRVWVWVVVFCTVTLLGIQSGTAQEKSISRNLLQFLKDDLGFSEKDLQSLKAQDVFTKRVDTPVKQEVAMVSVARINVPEDFFIQHTTFGFKLLKPVDETLEYMDAWENWVVFTRGLLRELKEVVGE